MNLVVLLSLLSASLLSFPAPTSGVGECDAPLVRCHDDAFKAFKVDKEDRGAQSALCEYLLSMSACADALAPCHQHKDVKYYRRTSVKQQGEEFQKSYGDQVDVNLCPAYVHLTGGSGGGSGRGKRGAEGECQDLEQLGKAVSVCHNAEIERARGLADRATRGDSRGDILCRGLQDMERTCLDMVRKCYSQKQYEQYRSDSVKTQKDYFRTIFPDATMNCYPNL